MKRSVIIAFALAPLAFPRAHAGQKLVVVGGGNRPPKACAQFVQWAGDDRSRIVVLTWAADHQPQNAFDGLQVDLAPFQPGALTHGVRRDQVAAQRDLLIQQILDATGIFFTGGDQNRIMDLLEQDQVSHPNDSLLDLLRSQYRSGTVFGGTSAGTALMSSPMLTGLGNFSILDGKQVGVRAGLNLLPGIIFDQHFLARHRLVRLMGLVQIYPTVLGLGVDEGTALLIQDSRFAEVVGDSHVLAIRSGRTGELVIDTLAPGARYDLNQRVRY